MEYPITLVRFGESKEIKNSGEEAVARLQGFCEPYKFQEYPKQLYKDGKREVHQVTFAEINTDSRAVKNAEEEKVARAAGYRSLGEPAPESVGGTEQAEEPEVQVKAKKSR